MASNKLKIQNFRTNDLINDGGKQFELGKSWCDDFFEFDKTQTEVVANLTFKPLENTYVGLQDKNIELRLAEVSSRGDRKAYVNGANGMSEIKNFFINDLHLTPEKNLNDYFAIYKVSELEYYLYFVPVLLYDNFLQFFKSALPTVSVTQKRDETQIKIYGSLQQIFYGAPGTGKSHEIKNQTEGKQVIRTTFHPDSDYSTFVGAYKPFVEKGRVYGAQGPLTENGKPIEEPKIIYKFVMQAFLKAYLGAWKKYVNRETYISVPLNLTFTIKSGKYTIKNIDSNQINLHKESVFDLSTNRILPIWNEIWETGTFAMPKGGSGRSDRQAVSQWIKDNVQDCTKNSLEEGLELLKQQIEKGNVTICKEGDSSQKYDISKTDEGYKVESDVPSTRDTLQNYYSGKEPKSGARDLHKKLASLLREIDSTSFVNAWNLLKSSVNNKKDKIDLNKKEQKLEPQFLVIEEINRGNCAQIFGDLFQLLDRSGNGFSEYPIEADTDLQKEIERAFREVKEYKLDKPIEIDDVIDNYKSNYDKTLSEDVQEGRVLLLPPNLYIWATMNTSDQSLFPIDSAFKRRWDWKYIKIKEGRDENGNKLDWKIKFDFVDKGGDTKSVNQDWWEFIKKINEIIASMTSSADKQLGYFFCKATDKMNPEDENPNVISEDTFVSKVIFYLWNDVFKDYGFEDALLFRYKDDEGVERDLTFPDFYDEDGENINTERLADFLKKVMDWKKANEENN